MSTPNFYTQRNFNLYVKSFEPMSREEFQGFLQNGRLLQTGGEREKERVDYFIFLLGMRRAYVADYLTAADQKIPD